MIEQIAWCLYLSVALIATFTPFSGQTLKNTARSVDHRFWALYKCVHVLGYSQVSTQYYIRVNVCDNLHYVTLVIYTWKFVRSGVWQLSTFMWMHSWTVEYPYILASDAHWPHVNARGSNDLYTISNLHIHRNQFANRYHSCMHGLVSGWIYFCRRPITSSVLSTICRHYHTLHDA